MKRKRTMTKRKMRVLTPSLLQLNLGHLKTEVHQQARQSIMPLFASDDDIGDLGEMADVVCVMGVVAVIAAVGESEALVLGRRRAAVEGAAAAAAATASSKRART